MNQPIKNNNNNMIPKQAIDPIGMPEEKGRHGTWADEKPSNCTCGIMKMQIRLQCGCDSTEAISSYGTKCSHTLLSKSASPDIVQAVAGPMCAPPPTIQAEASFPGQRHKELWVQHPVQRLHVQTVVSFCLSTIWLQDPASVPSWGCCVKDSMWKQRWDCQTLNVPALLPWTFWSPEPWEIHLVVCKWPSLGHFVIVIQTDRYNRMSSFEYLHPPTHFYICYI